MLKYLTVVSGGSKSPNIDSSHGYRATWVGGLLNAILLIQRLNDLIPQAEFLFIMLQW